MAQLNTGKLKILLTNLNRRVPVPLWIFVIAIIGGAIAYVARAPRPVRVEQHADAESYSVGFLLARQLKPIRKEIDFASAERGFKHGLAADDKDEPADISAEERAIAMGRIQDRQAAARQSAATSALAESGKFIAEIKSKPNVRELEDGIYIEPVGTTKGPLAAKDRKERTSLTIAYQAKRADGGVFDPGSETGIDVKPQILVPGLRKALDRMPEGAHWNIYLSPAQAFGPAERPGLPAQSAVVYTVKLIKVK